MRSFFLLVLLSFCTINHRLQAADAQEVAEKYRDLFLTMPDVNGIGISACNAQSGERQPHGDLPCVVVLFSSEVSFNAASEEWHVPFLLEGVWVNFEYVGVISAQPGVTVNN